MVKLSNPSLPRPTDRWMCPVTKNINTFRKNYQSRLKGMEAALLVYTYTSNEV